MINFDYGKIMVYRIELMDPTNNNKKGNDFGNNQKKKKDKSEESGEILKNKLDIRI